MSTNRRQTDWRAAIDKELRSTPLTDYQWNDLVEKRYDNELENGDTTVAEVVAMVRSQRETWGGGRQPNPGPPPADQLPRLRALAALRTKEASQAPDVCGIRSRLPEALLDPAEIPKWIDRQPGTKHLLLSARDSSVSGVPDEILTCVRRLAETYHWLVEDALAFVLAGIVPAPQWAEVRVAGDGPETRITLSVDPEISPRTVQSLYAKARKFIQARERVRSMTEKRAELARFVVEQPEGRTWRERMNRWNDLVCAEHPGWRYRYDTNFNRDARGALRRLTEPGWSWSETDHTEEDTR